MTENITLTVSNSEFYFHIEVNPLFSQSLCILITDLVDPLNLDLILKFDGHVVLAELSAPSE